MINSSGERMYEFIKKIYPYCRSITGEGVRKTLSDINEYISHEGLELNIYSVATGTTVFDWQIPKEWKINSAYIEDEEHNRIIDMCNHNLHVMGYSAPIDEWVDLEELKKHIYTQPDQPDVIPYVTSYYQERFGFCMSQNQLDMLEPGLYHMYIDSELFDGELNYAEIIIPGERKEEIFFSTYFCHPSMANNECSGPAVQSELIKFVNTIRDRKYTYRFIFVPETIGSLTYMSQNDNLKHMKENIIAGFNLTCVGDNRDYSIVTSKYADTLADRVLLNVLQNHTGGKFSKYSFLKRGSDERQYNSAGVDLPVVCFCRSKYHEYPEYHTSADDLSFISADGLQGALDVMKKTIIALEYNEKYKMTVCGEPQLGKRGLLPTISQKFTQTNAQAMKDFIAYADGRNDLIGISDIIHLPIEQLIEVVDELLKFDLITISK